MNAKEAYELIESRVRDLSDLLIDYDDIYIKKKYRLRMTKDNLDLGKRLLKILGKKLKKSRLH